jgi:hypothetical protein
VRVGGRLPASSSSFRVKIPFVCKFACCIAIAVRLCARLFSNNEPRQGGRVWSRSL